MKQLSQILNNNNLIKKLEKYNTHTEEPFNPPQKENNQIDQIS